MTTTQSVTLERILDAPIGLAWQMWTQADHFAAWYGPTGASVQVTEMDVRVGGRRHFSMQFPTPGGDQQMWFVGEFRVVDPPTTLVYTESMSDADGSVVPPEALGLPSDHPEATEVTVQFEELDGQTRIVMTHAGVPGRLAGCHGVEHGAGQAGGLLAA